MGCSTGLVSTVTPCHARFLTGESLELVKQDFTGQTPSPVTQPTMSKYWHTA